MAGGTATRLFPLTATTSKQLFPVYDQQMIFYPLNVLIKAEIKEILIIIASENSGQFINPLRSIFEGIGIHLEFCVQKIPRGLVAHLFLGETFVGRNSVAMALGIISVKTILVKKSKSLKVVAWFLLKK